MLVRLYGDNPSERELARVVETLDRGGVVAYPTDGVYAFGCSIRAPRAIERIERIKGKGAAEFSLVFDSLSQIADYCRVDNNVFRSLKRNLPGAFTFILPALSHMPDRVLPRRRTIGVRMPDAPIARAIVARLEMPMATASIVAADDEGYMVDPSLVEERYGAAIDLVADGGMGSVMCSTIVDFTDGEAEIVRQGEGVLR